MNAPCLAQSYSIASQKSQWVRIGLALPHTEAGRILIALCFVPVVMVESQHCEQGMSKNTPVSIICFYTPLLEVSQGGGGAYRGFTSPLATRLCFSVPVQGTVSSSPGVRRQRHGMHLFYYS